jgi:hypothetical protein
VLSPTAAHRAQDALWQYQVRARGSLSAAGTDRVGGLHVQYGLAAAGKLRDPGAQVSIALGVLLSRRWRLDGTGGPQSIAALTQKLGDGLRAYPMAGGSEPLG